LARDTMVASLRLVGKILRIVPDLREHTTTSTVSDNGRYRLPNDNPFTTLEGARKEIWAYGLRNPHRLIWDADPARPTEPRLLASHIGLVSWETVVVIRKGANYGWPLREGTQARALDGMAPIPADDTMPIHISDTLTRGSVKPTYPILQYPHRPGGGDAIANGFIYRGPQVSALKDRLVFGDIATGRLWYADRAALLAADDANPESVAPIHCQESRARHTGVDRRRQGGLRRRLRRVPRRPRAGRGEGEGDDLDHRGAGRQAAAGPHRRAVGPRHERRRDRHRREARAAADDDARLREGDIEIKARSC
jgi:hypothetical protein